jgi:hypothetical protein
MAAVTGPGSSLPPPGTRRRRRVLVGVAVAWGVVVAGLAVWSVKHSPATVPEQRTIGQAMPELQQAAGVVFAAAGGPGRAVVLDGLQVASGCRVTPVRQGVSVTRDVTVYVRAGEQRGDIEAIAAALPARYRVQVTPSRGGTRFVLHADAGNFIGIDMDATVGDSSLTLRLSSGCRPVGAGGVDRADPSAGPPPARLNDTLAALGAPESAAARVTVQSVGCPDGGTAGTYAVGGVAAPGDWPRRLAAEESGAIVVRSDTSRRAFRTGNDSVVVVSDGHNLRVSVSTAC